MLKKLLWSIGWVGLLMSGGLLGVSGQEAHEITHFKVGSGTISSAAWSPDGTRLAVSEGENSTVQIWDSGQSGEPLVTFQTDLPSTIAWMPDGKKVISFGYQANEQAVMADTWRWDAETGERLDNLFNFQSGSDVLPLLAWNRDFTQVAVSIRDHLVKISETQVLEAGGSITQFIAWSPENSRIAVASSDSEAAFIELFDAVSGRVIQRLEPTTSFVGDMQWSSDGLYLAVVGLSGDAAAPDRQIDVYALAGGDTREALLPPIWTAQGDLIEWSPSRSFLAVTGAEQISLYDVEQQTVGLALAISGVTALDWSPDGSQLATGTENGTLYIWNMTGLMQS